MRAVARLGALRARAESRMTSTARVRRPTGGYVTDTDGYEVPEWVDVITSTPFRLGKSGGGTRSRTRDAAGVEVEVPNRTGHFPYGTTDLRDGDYIEVTAGDTAGMVVRIVEADQADQLTAVRVSVEGVERPTEWGA